MDVKEAQAILKAEPFGPRWADARGFLDCLEQLKATGAREALYILIEAVHHSPTCLEPKSEGGCNCDFHEALIKGVKALNKLNALIGDESPEGIKPMGEE